MFVALKERQSFPALKILFKIKQYFKIFAADKSSQQKLTRGDFPKFQFE